MNLTLSPIYGTGRAETSLSVSGDTLTCDGTAYDLSAVPEGGCGWPEGAHPFIGPVTRSAGVICCEVLVHLGPEAAAIQPDAPEHWRLSVTEGVVRVPAIRIDMGGL